MASISLRTTCQFQCPRRLDTWGERFDFRSPSLELAKIQVSPGFFPYREPSGSVLITCSMAFPTSPEPPVTRTTSLVAMIVKRLKDRTVSVGPGFAVIKNDPDRLVLPRNHHGVPHAPRRIAGSRTPSHLFHGWLHHRWHTRRKVDTKTQRGRPDNLPDETRDANFFPPPRYPTSLAIKSSSRFP